jgi:hypothetical protein
MARMRKAAVALLGVVLGGCGLFGGSVPPPCPRVMMLGDAQQVTVFLPGPGRDLTDVLSEGEITDVRSVCEYDDDGYVDVEVAIAMVLSRGPAMEDDTGRFEYFVAVTDPEDRILAKEIFDIDVGFPAALMRVAVTEEVSQRIFFRNRPDASGHRVIVGFQLTREQIEYQGGGGL